MKIFKNQYGYGHETIAHNKQKETSYYMSINFTKDSEPTEDIEGELIFKDTYGREYSCWFSSFNSKEGVKPTLMMKLIKDEEIDTKIFGGSRSQSMETVQIEPNDLPFDGFSENSFDEDVPW